MLSEIWVGDQHENPKIVGSNPAAHSFLQIFLGNTAGKFQGCRKILVLIKYKSGCRTGYFFPSS
jgi:hypothetical protein